MDKRVINDFENVTNVRAGTPVHSVVLFYSGWKAKNLNTMLEFSSPTWKDKPKAKEKLQLWFKGLTLKGMQLINSKRINDTNYKIICKTAWIDEMTNKKFVNFINVDVVCEKGVNQESIDGKWYVRPITMVHTLNIVLKIFIESREDIGFTR
jgi:hypothetical protein